MHRLNFNHLFHFHIIAEEGSLARAAQRLRLTQPTLSAQLKQVEETLGRQLFDRKPGGGLVLNEAGRLARERTAAMFRAGEGLLEDFGASPGPELRALRIAVVSTVSSSVAAQFLLTLLGLEEVRLIIRSAEHRWVLYHLESSDVDAVLTDTPPSLPSDRGIAQQLVWRPQLVFVASPELARQLVSWPGALEGAPFVQYLQEARHRWELDRFLRDHAVVPHVLVETDDLGLMIAAARRGTCVAAVPRSLVMDDLRSGRLVELGALGDPDAGVYALYREQLPSELVLAAVDRLRRTAGAFDGAEAAL